MNNDVKRLFFAFKTVTSAFKYPLPKGRIIDTDHLHATLVFIGDLRVDKYTQIIQNIPKPPFFFSLFGIFDKLLFLPTPKKNVASYHIQLDKEDENKINQYKNKIIDYLYDLNVIIEPKPLLLHTTFARKPFDEDAWKQHFEKKAVLLNSFCLYESVGNLKYKSVFEYKLHPLFEEVYHTADIAFTIYGLSLQDIYRNAQKALGYIYNEFIAYFNDEQVECLDHIIIKLNKIVSTIDIEIGCPVKAISMHGMIEKTNDQLLKWQMIVDV